MQVRCNTVSISGREVVLSNITFTASLADPIEFEIEMPIPQNEPQVRLHCIGRIVHWAPLGTTLTIERYVFQRGTANSG